MVVRLAPCSGWRRGFNWCGLSYDGVSDSRLWSDARWCLGGGFFVFFYGFLGDLIDGGREA